MNMPAAAGKKLQDSTKPHDSASGAERAKAEKKDVECYLFYYI